MSDRAHRRRDTVSSPGDQRMRIWGIRAVRNIRRLRAVSANGSGTLVSRVRPGVRRGRMRHRFARLVDGDTLTLIDGERMVSYPLERRRRAQLRRRDRSPFNAVDAVEVLEDGASAVYRADAIAGVVDVKLKKSYVGSEPPPEVTRRGTGTARPNMGPASWAPEICRATATTSMCVDWHRKDRFSAAMERRYDLNGRLSRAASTPSRAPSALLASRIPDSVTRMAESTRARRLARPTRFFRCFDQAWRFAEQCTLSAYMGQIRSPSTPGGLVAAGGEAISG